MLAGKVIVVAGAGPGLGRQVALLAAGAGATVVVAARRRSVVDEIAHDVVAVGGRAVAASCDVTSQASCRALVETAEERCGGIDGLVVNAVRHGPFATPVESADFDEWRDVFETNVFGALHVVQAAVPALRQRAGSVVLVSSQIVRRVVAGRGAYASSKAAMVAVGQVLARELGPDGIRVNSLVPGAMWGPPLQEVFLQHERSGGPSVDQQYADRSALLALDRIPTDAECARAAVFLLSDLAAGMTGQTLDVNGGETLN